MSRIPRNVQQVLQENQRVESALKYSSDLRKGNVTAKWFEHDFQRAKAGTGTLGSTARKDTPQELRDAGLRTGIETVKLTRQARLKELYDREALAYEAELHEQGLSLVKPRD